MNNKDECITRIDDLIRQGIDTILKSKGEPQEIINNNVMIAMLGEDDPFHIMRLKKRFMAVLIEIISTFDNSAILFFRRLLSALII